MGTFDPFRATFLHAYSHLIQVPGPFLCAYLKGNLSCQIRLYNPLSTTYPKNKKIGEIKTLIGQYCYTDLGTF